MFTWNNIIAVNASSEQPIANQAPQTSWLTVRFYVHDSFRNSKNPKSYAAITNKLQDHHQDGNMGAHREFQMVLGTQGGVMALGKAATFSSHHLPHLLLSSHRLTGQAALLCLPQVIHLPVSPPNLTRSVPSRTGVGPSVFLHPSWTHLQAQLDFLRIVSGLILQCSIMLRSQGF